MMLMKERRLRERLTDNKYLNCFDLPSVALYCDSVGVSDERYCAA